MAAATTAGYPPVEAGRVAAIVCRAQSCSLPITEPEALKRELARE